MPSELNLAASSSSYERSRIAIKHTSTAATRSLDGEVTVEEIKEWLKRFDTDKDGGISREELRRAIRSINRRFSGRTSARGIRYADADADADGFINDDEINNLVEFAQKVLGFKIVPY